MVQVVRKSDKAAWARINTAVKSLKATELQVGWFPGARYEDGTPVAFVATVHEFGASKQGIPPRPFMRPTIARERERWGEFVEQEAKKIIAGTQTAPGMFEVLGLNVSGEIARSITEVTQPPLKPATIAAKRRKLANKGTTGALSKPLVETGLMLASVTHVVIE